MVYTLYVKVRTDSSPINLMITQAFGFRLPANALEGQKRFSISTPRVDGGDNCTSQFVRFRTTVCRR
jgi:hypothetical protein